MSQTIITTHPEVSHCILAKSYEELFSIHRREFNLGLMKSEIPVRVTKYLEENIEEFPTIIKRTISKDHFEEDIEVINDLYLKTGDEPTRLEFVNHLKEIISNFADVSDAPLLGVSIEKVTSDMCKFYHCDMNHLRLVMTLLGPGTLWTSNENVNREHLRKSANELVLKDKDKVFQAKQNEIVLLKGQGHPTSHNLAIVHASPKIIQENKKRILLRIESIF